MDDHFIEGIIQYNQRKRHFRTIKMYGKNKTTILDGESIISYNEEDQRRIIIYDREWRNYIVTFKTYQGSEEITTEREQVWANH
jgi:hypothetical protein